MADKREVKKTAPGKPAGRPPESGGQLRKKKRPARPQPTTKPIRPDSRPRAKDPGARPKAKNPNARRRVRESTPRPKAIEPKLRVAEGSIDYLFAAIVAVLLIFGMIMMFSASYIEGIHLSTHDGYFYLKKQMMAAVIGIILLCAICIFDYHIFLNTKVVVLGYIAAVGLLTFTTFKGVGQANAVRWIEIPGIGFNFQTSEAVKAVLIIVLSYVAVKDMKTLHIGKIKIDKGRFMLLVMAPIAVNMVLQRHISGLFIMCLIFGCILVMSEMRWRDIIALCIVLVIAAAIAITLVTVLKGGDFSYILDRIFGSDDGDYQAKQSKIAMGSGGLFGMGFGASRQKYLWLPEAQNDFIIGIVVEELGFIGGMAVVILFLLLIFRGFRIAKSAPDKFGTLIVSGVIFQLGAQAIFNIGVACDAFPTTGVSLPFFSYGGSALMIQLAEVGVVLSVSRHCNNI